MPHTDAAARFADLLRTHRRALRLTGAELAGKIGDPRFDWASWVRSVESGRQRATTEQMVTVALALGLDPSTVVMECHGLQLPSFTWDDIPPGATWADLP